MSESSWPWSTVAAVGDGTTTLSEALSREFLALYFGVQDPAVEGVSKGVLNELAVSGTASPISIATGSAICYGLYRNTAVVTKAITTPAVGTTGFRVVLQTNWAGVGGAAQASTRIAVVQSADGVAAIPALTQTFGTTWEISLATGTITTGGVITLTDARNFRKSTAVVGTNELVALAVTTAKIALLNITTALINDLAVTTGKIAANAVTFAKFVQSAAAGLSVVGRSANSAGDFAEIVAGTDGHVLRRSGTTLGFGTVVAAGLASDAVTTAKILDANVTLAKLAADSVDDTKAGNRVPQFYRRQGGDAADWSVPGSTNRTPTAVRMQAGIISMGSIPSENVVQVGVTFPTAFSNKPIVLATPFVNGAAGATVEIGAVSATQATLNVKNTAGAPVSFDCFWLAIGPE